MDCKKIYESIIEKANSENREKGNGIYYESHHIVPKCLGGSDTKDNKVLLTAKEHFVCHKLLTRIYPDSNGIRFSFFLMCQSSDNQERYQISSRDYEYACELNRQACLGNRWRRGKKAPHSEETKKILSKHFSEHLPKYAFKKGMIPWNKNTLTEDQKKYIKEHTLSMEYISKKFGISKRQAGDLKHGHIDGKRLGVTEKDIQYIREHTQNCVQIANKFKTTQRIVSIIKNS